MKIIKLLEEHGFELLGNDSGCACGNAELFGVKIETHCHRSPCKEHECSCVHISTHKFKNKELKKLGKYLKKEIEEGYRTEVEVMICT